jgi:hypothetical protein
MKNPVVRYYKVVSRNRTAFGAFLLESAMVDGPPKVTYHINKWVSATAVAKEKGYGLFVFDSIEAATEFASRNRIESYVIYRCYVRGVHRQLPPYLCNYNLCDYFYDDKPPMKSCILSWPPGTVMVDRVKLIEEVTYECDNK